MTSVFPSALPTVLAKTLVWRKRTGQVIHETNYEVQVTDMITDTAHRFWEQTLQHGDLNSSVRVGSKRGMSVQVYDGKWVSSESTVEVSVPCGHHPDSIAAAYGLASDLSSNFLNAERNEADAALDAHFGKG
jgi:hypothetical protein